MSNFPIPRVITLFFLISFCACAAKPKLLKPQIIKIEPTSGPTYGTYSIFIIGNGFDSKAKITIGGKEVKDVRLGQLFFVTVPPGPDGKVDVVVTNPDNRQAVLKEGFTYLVYPTIKNIKPTEGTIKGGELVTIRGDGFEGGTIVEFGKQKAEVKLVSGEAIQVVSPPHPAGVVDITIINPGGFSFLQKDAFTYNR